MNLLLNYDGAQCQTSKSLSNTRKIGYLMTDE